MSIQKLNELKEHIGDLKVKNELGETIVCTSAKSKVDTLCSFFSSVFFVMKHTITLNQFEIEYVFRNVLQ